MERMNRVLSMLVAIIVLLCGTVSALAEGCSCENCTCCTNCTSCEESAETTEVEVTTTITVTTNQIFDKETGSLGASMIISNRTQRIVGANSPNEDFGKEPFLPYQSPICDFPQGIYGDDVWNVVREKKWAKINLNEINNGTYLGMTHFKEVIVTIEAEDYAKVVEIVNRLCSKNFNMEHVEINQETIILSTIYFYANTNGICYAGHMFFPSYVDRICVGFVRFENGGTALLYRGDFDGDGLQELGFAPGHYITQKPAPEPEPEPEPEKPQPPKPVRPKPPCQPKNECNKNGCKIVINIVNSFNILTNICQRFVECIK